MNEIQTKDTFTSLEILEQINIFRKEENKNSLAHSDFLKVIRKEFAEEIAEGKISLGLYKDKQNQNRPLYILTPNQSKQVLLKESRMVRRKVIEYIDKLENHIKTFGANPNYIPQNYSEALYLAAKQQEKIQEQVLLLESKDKEIKEMKYKSDYLDKILNSDNAMNITQIANAFDMTSRQLNKILKENKVQYKCGNTWVLSNKYLGNNYTFQKAVPIIRADGRLDAVMHTMWTQKGRMFIYELLQKLGYFV